MEIRIATRSSKLALWQANDFSKLISQNIPGASARILPIVTDGDRIQDRPLHEVEGKTLFIKEVENALLSGDADVAVHCIKDFHPETPPEFKIAAFLERASDRDLMIFNKPIKSLAELPIGATVGTTSQRRIFFLKKARPDLKFKMLRGNIDSRLHKLSSGNFDAIVLAEAGVDRLNIKLQNALLLSDDIMLPAVGQGGLAVEVCTTNSELADMLKIFDHTPTRICVAAERALVSGLSANCKSAVGANCMFLEDGQIRLRGHVGHPDDLREISGEIIGDPAEAKALGADLASRFLDRGAAAILE